MSEACSDPTEFLADDLSAPLPEGYSEKVFEGLSLKKVFGKGYKDVLETKKFYVIIRGGKGSKKSKTIALLLIMRMMMYPLANTVCIRKSYNALKDSMFTDLLWAMDRLKVTDWWEIRRVPMQLELKHTHQVILFRGLDKAEKLGGLTVRHGYLCWMWIDEFYEITDEEEFIKAQMGLRGYMPPETGLWKQIFCTFNPWSEHTWIKKRFFDEPHDDVLAKVTTYKCNEWLGEEDRQRYDDLYKTNPRIAKVICDGEWGIVEGLVYENWSIEAFDVEEIRKRPNVHEAFGLDFGFAVSYTAFAGFLIDPVSHELWIFEDSIYKQRMTTLDIVKAIEELGYADRRIVADCAQPKTIYELKAGVVEEDEFGFARRHSLPNIEASMKGNDSVVNGITRLQMYKMYVHPRCTNAIMELSSYYYEKDSEGKYTGKPHKEFDHCLVAGTMVLTDHGEVPIEDIQVGDMVLTHLGYKRVLASGITRPEPAEIWRMTCEDGTIIEGTADHPIPTTDGLKYLYDISNGEEVIKWIGYSTQCSSKSMKRPFCMMGWYGADNLTVPEESPECISGPILGFLARKKYSSCTDIYGRNITDLHPKGHTSIMSTKTLLTTGCLTWNACPLRIMCMNTPSQRNVEWKLQRGCGATHPNRICVELGMHLKKGMSGMSSMGRRLQPNSSPACSSAFNVEGNSGKSHLVQSNSVLTDVSLRIEEHLASMTRREFVHGVVKNSQSTNMIRCRHAQDIVQTSSCTPPKATISTTELIAQCKPLKVVSVESTGRKEVVYDLTVAEAHDFFANGLLNHNCLDSIRYGAERFIVKAKGKVVEAKGGTSKHTTVVSANGDNTQTQPVHRVRRVVSSSKGSRI